jgi:hypothetical protein
MEDMQTLKELIMKGNQAFRSKPHPGYPQKATNSCCRNERGW